MASLGADRAPSELRIELQLPSLGRAKYPGLFPSLSFPSSSDLHPLDDTPSQAPTPWSSAAWQNSPDTPRTGLLPEEERSWLHYLAEISLRSLMSRVLAGLYGAEAASWPSMSGLERLQDAYIDQVDEWHATLPPQLAFDRVLPLRQHDHFRPSNELSFFLQTRHTGVLEWIYRPSLYIVLHADRPCQQHVSLASQALGAAVALIKIVAAHHRHGGIWQWLRRSFGAALTLIAAAVHSHRATLQGPSACRLDVPRDWAALVRLSMATLRDWGGGQTVDLARMEGILRDLLTAALADINT